MFLTLTPAAKTAIAEFCNLKREANEGESGDVEKDLEMLSNIELGNPIDHIRLIDISNFLVQQGRKEDENAVRKEWRLETLLKGALVHEPPSLPKPEPVRLIQKAFGIMILCSLSYRRPNTKA